MLSASSGWLHYHNLYTKCCFSSSSQRREGGKPWGSPALAIMERTSNRKTWPAVRSVFSRSLVQPRGVLVYSQSDALVCVCRFVGECGEWVRAGLRDGTASRFRQGRPGLALHAPVWVISFSSDAFWFSAVLGFFLKINKETFEGTDCIFGKKRF